MLSVLYQDAPAFRSSSSGLAFYAQKRLKLALWLIVISLMPLKLENCHVNHKDPNQPPRKYLQ